MKKTIAAIITVSLIGGLAYSQFINAGTGSEEGAAWAPPPTAVSVQTVAPTALANTITGIGTVEAVRQVDVASEVAGRIQSIHFESGQTVSQGDVLIRLNDETDKAELKRLAARLSLAQKQYNRVTKLKSVAVSQSRIDEARSTLDEVRAEIASIKTSQGKKSIVAPFDGVLGVRLINLGQYLNPGEAVVNITDLTQFNVNFKLPENASRSLAVGQEVRLTVDALGEAPLSALITTIEPQIERGLHTISVQAKVSNPPMSLRPGLFAEVEVNLGQDQQVILVPETAVERSTFGNSVYVVKPGDGDTLLAEQVAVQTGRRSNAQIVISTGLKAGDQVIVSGQNRLYYGATVSVKPPETTVDMIPQSADAPAPSDQ